MKRKATLIPLSHDHHHGLVLALRLQRSQMEPHSVGIPKGEAKAPPRWRYLEATSHTADWPSEPKKQAMRVAEYFDSEMQYHFAEEERVVFPSLQQFLQSGETIVDDLMREHRQMETMIQQIKEGMQNSKELEKLLSYFGKFLEKHIHREENELFPLFEEVVPEQVATKVGQQLEEVRKQWRKSKPKVEFKRSFRPLLPNEHGAWAAWMVPFFIGAYAAVEIVWQVIIPMFLSTLFLFLSYFPFTILIQSRQYFYDEWTLRHAKSWAAIYFTLGFLCGLPLVMLLGRPLLLIFAALAWGSFLLRIFLRVHKLKAVASDLAAVMGLTFTAPATYYALKGAIDITALSLWILNLLFFAGMVFYVHMKIDARSAKKEFRELKERLRVGKFNLLYYLLMLAVIVTFVILRLVPPQVIFAYLPITVQAVYGTFQLSHRVSFKKLGFALLGQSLIFGIFFALFFH